MPALSIITAVRNGLPLIERAYRSITAQTSADWKWLTVDDSSTDGTGELLGSLAARDPRVRLLLHHENQGAAAARNTGGSGREREGAGSGKAPVKAGKE